ncbi:MAG: flavin reductase family protein [Anaerovoracaceae bacterium]|jgi:flavin reductase (DIM6/NTAB) family NADH-FMN oxidoreductase RutF
MKEKNEKITLEKIGTYVYPLPAIMVSCGGTPETYNIITAAWTGTINSDPPMAYVSIRKSRYSHEIISRTGEFVINLTTEELSYVTDWCGVNTGRKVNKFMEMDLTPIKGRLVGCPMIAEAPVNIECKVSQVLELGSHDMFIADVIAIHADASLVDEKGRLDLSKAGLLVFNDGLYCAMKEKPIGNVGYSLKNVKE